MFDKVDQKVSFPGLEKEMMARWKDEGTFQKSLELRAGRPRFVFYEGPPTANGKPATHHILARAFNYELPARAGRPAVTRPAIHMPELGVHCQAIIESRHVDVIEMDAASHTGIDDVREMRCREPETELCHVASSSSWLRRPPETIPV